MKKILILLFFITGLTFAKKYRPSTKELMLELYRRRSRGRNAARLARLRHQFFSPSPQHGTFVVREMDDAETARRVASTQTNRPVLTFGETRINWT